MCFPGVWLWIFNHRHAKLLFYGNTLRKEQYTVAITNHYRACAKLITLTSFYWNTLEKICFLLFFYSWLPITFIIIILYFSFYLPSQRALLVSFHCYFFVSNVRRCIHLITVGLMSCLAWISCFPLYVVKFFICVYLHFVITRYSDLCLSIFKYSLV